MRMCASIRSFISFACRPCIPCTFRSECPFLTPLQAPHQLHKGRGNRNACCSPSTISDVSDPLFSCFFSQLFSFQDLKMFGVVLNACDRGKQWEVALSLLTQMHISSITPGQIACNSVATWSKKYGQVTFFRMKSGKQWKHSAGWCFQYVPCLACDLGSI